MYKRKFCRKSVKKKEKKTQFFHGSLVSHSPPQQLLMLPRLGVMHVIKGIDSYYHVVFLSLFYLCCVKFNLTRI